MRFSDVCSYCCSEPMTSSRSTSGSRTRPRRWPGPWRRSRSWRRARGRRRSGTRRCCRCRSRCAAWAMVESHVRAERTVLRARRRHVQRADIAVYRGPGIHRSKRAADRRGITATRSDQQIAVSQPKHKAVGCTVAIEIGPEHNVPCRIDCLHRITGECQTETFTTINGIEEHDDFPPISRRSCEPTRVEGIGGGTVVRKESNLSGVVN